MCGRYIFFDEKNEKIKELIEIAKLKMKEKDFSEISLFEVFPNEKAFAGYAKDDHFAMTVMKWGYSSKTMIINARSETCFDSNFFQGSLPCVIPATFYFEWSKDPKIKYAFHIEEEPFYLGGLYRKENDGNHFVILTEESQGKCKEIHNRQPILFTRSDGEDYCSSKNPSSFLEHSVQNRIIQKV